MSGELEALQKENELLKLDVYNLKSQNNQLRDTLQRVGHLYEKSKFKDQDYAEYKSPPEDGPPVRVLVVVNSGNVAGGWWQTMEKAEIQLASITVNDPARGPYSVWEYNRGSKLK